MTTLHTDLLRLLGAVDHYGLAADALLADLRQGRHRDLALPDLERALRDLTDQSLIFPYTSVLRQKRWRISSLGTSALQEAGL